MGVGAQARGARRSAVLIGAAGARRSCGRQARARGACAAGASRALGARAVCRRAACAHLGVLAGLWVVRLVHLACF